ncbi:MAG TPA: hypothetical protein VI382_02890 [Candidatus Manganitrophaceae bacterium]|nr:hypothetical protein [Candidatus Manganitrophaceae bacterium]
MSFWKRNNIGLSIGPSHLSIALVDRRGESVEVKRHSALSIPKGVYHPSPIEKNITNIDRWRDHVRLLLNSIPERGALSISIPDTAARILLLDLERLPPGRKDFEKLIQWHMEKVFLVPLGESRFSYQALSNRGGRWKVLATAIKREVIDQYEALDGRGSAQNGKGGIDIRSVGLSSLCAFNLFFPLIRRSAGDAADFIFVHLLDQNLTALIFQDGILDFIRVKELPEGEEGSDRRADLLLEELAASLSFYGGAGKGLSGLNHLFLSLDSPIAGLENRIQETFHLQSTPLDPARLIRLVPPPDSDRTDGVLRSIAPAVAAAVGG